MNPLVTVVNTAARIANWVLSTRVDAVVCRWANQTGDDDA